MMGFLTGKGSTIYSGHKYRPSDRLAKPHFLCRYRSLDNWILNQHILIEQQSASGTVLSHGEGFKVDSDSSPFSWNKHLPVSWLTPKASMDRWTSYGSTSVVRTKKRFLKGSVTRDSKPETIMRNPGKIMPLVEVFVTDFPRGWDFYSKTEKGWLDPNQSSIHTFVQLHQGYKLLSYSFKVFL